MVLLLILGICASMTLAAFCAGAETGFLSVSRGRILHMARQGGARAKVVQQAIADLGRTTTTLLVGNNLASVSFSSASAALSVALFPSSPSAQTAWGVVAAFLMLYFCEFLPKLLCAARPLRRLLFLVPGWRVFEFVFAPVGFVVQSVIVRLLPKRETKVRVTPETVLRILQDRKDGVKLSDFESALIGRIVVLRSRGEFILPETLLSALDD